MSKVLAQPIRLIWLWTLQAFKAQILLCKNFSLRLPGTLGPIRKVQTLKCVARSGSRCHDIIFSKRDICNVAENVVSINLNSRMRGMQSGWQKMFSTRARWKPEVQAKYSLIEQMDHLCRFGCGMLEPHKSQKFKQNGDFGPINQNPGVTIISSNCFAVWWANQLPPLIR